MNKARNNRLNYDECKYGALVIRPCNRIKRVPLCWSTGQEDLGDGSRGGGGGVMQARRTSFLEGEAVQVARFFCPNFPTWEKSPFVTTSLRVPLLLMLYHRWTNHPYPRRHRGLGFNESLSKPSAWCCCHCHLLVGRPQETDAVKTWHAGNSPSQMEFDDDLGFFLTVKETQGLKHSRNSIMSILQHFFLIGKSRTNGISPTRERYKLT